MPSSLQLKINAALARTAAKLSGRPPPPDPLLHVPITGDVVQDSANEISATLAAFKARHARENKDKRAALDSEYWFCVCFQTREQKEQFLRAMQWDAAGDKYLDGTLLAAQEKIDLPAAKLTFLDSKPNKRLCASIPAIRPVGRVAPRAPSGKKVNKHA